MTLFKSRPRRRRTPPSFRSRIEALESRIALTGDPYGTLAQEIAEVIGNYRDSNSPAWSYIYEGLANGCDGLRPEVSGPNGTDSGTYTINGVTYNWNSSYFATVTSDGTQGGDSSGQTDWSESVTLTTSFDLNGSGGDGITSTVVTQHSYYTIDWTAEGDIG